MAKDYASRTRKQRKPKRSVRFEKRKANTKKTPKKPAKLLRRLLGLSLVILIVLLVIFFIHKTKKPLLKPSPAAPISYTAGESLSGAAHTDNTPTAVVAPPIQFVFTANKENASETLQYYMLQLGTFSKESASLKKIQQKLQSAQQKYHLARTVRGDETQYRLEVGPYYSNTSANTAWQTLYDHNIYALIRPAYESDPTTP